MTQYLSNLLPNGSDRNGTELLNHHVNMHLISHNDVAAAEQSIRRLQRWEYAK